MLTCSYLIADTNLAFGMRAEQYLGATGHTPVYGDAIMNSDVNDCLHFGCKSLQLPANIEMIL